MNFLIRTACGAIALLSLSACATVFDGTTQRITISSSPLGAECVVVRAGDMLAPVGRTPFVITVAKTKNDIQVDCMKDGYAQASDTLTSDIAAATFGDALVGSVSGWAIDSIVGADNKYSSSITVDLKPLTAEQLAAASVRLQACSSGQVALANFAVREGYQYRMPCRAG